MRMWAQRGVCAWVVVFAFGCAPEVPAGDASRPERSLTLRAEVSREEPPSRALDSQDAAPVTSDDALEAFDGAVPPTRPVLLVRQGESRLGLPLESASYDSFVVGTVAETIVKQRYFNPLPRTIEAVYVFPLPHDGGVFDYSIRVQDRTLRGQMKRREEARALYEKAKEQGHTAGMLEQQRPNVFTQSVANIPPGEAIEVELRVVQPLARQDGRYRLVLPTVVGPRYVPGTPIGSVPAGSFAADTDRVPDGSKITPMPQLSGPPLRPNLSIRVAIENGLLVDDVRSKHHDVELHDEDGAAHITLTSGTTLANRDFELSWSEGGGRARAGLMVQPELEGDGGYFTLTLEPPQALPTHDAVPRELVFVVDCSGSMSGVPIETAKEAMRKVLGKLAPSDVFQIVQFSQSASSLGKGFLPSTPQSVKRGLAFVDAMAGEGGTEMLAGVRAAFDLPRDPKRLRMVLFLTDGYIGNETEIFREVRARIGDARLFSLGVGSSVNRYLLDGLSRMGRGDVSYVSAGQGAQSVVDRFFERIDRPALTDVEIDWGNLVVQDVEPQRLPDLFAGNPVVVFGRYRGAPSGELMLRGRRAGALERVPIAVDFARPRASSAALSAMWARSRIARLSDQAIEQRSWNGRDLTEQIVKLALEHHVMTEHTAFVAVDDARVVPRGTQTVHVPLALPSGVSAEGVFGSEAAALQGVSRKSAGSHGFGGLGLRGTIGHGVGGGAAGAIGRNPTAALGATMGHGAVDDLLDAAVLGHGSGGMTSGHGRESGAFHGRDAAVPRVRSGKLDVRGSLSAEVIRRILHRHVNEVRFCYEQALSQRPKLRGRVRLKLVISPTGSVPAAGLLSSAIGDAKVERCLVQAARRWKFPAPSDGGIVVVIFPYDFEPTGDPAATSPRP